MHLGILHLGRLHLHPTEYAIKYSNEDNFTYGPFYVNPNNPITADNRILLRSPHRGKSLDLNLNNTKEDLLKWLYHLKKRDQTNENLISIDALIDLLSSHDTPRNSYVYIFHSLNGTPEYVGVKHDYSQRFSYEGSSNTYTPESGSLVKIIAKNLDPSLGLKVENFVIEKLSKNYKLYNNTRISKSLQLTPAQIEAFNLNSSTLPIIETFTLK